MARAIVLSIHRQYAEAIVAGTKHYELRRRNLGIREGDVVLLYETAPESVIQSAFLAGLTTKRLKERLWVEQGHALGVEKSFYDKYLSDTPFVFATEVLEAFPLPPISPEALPGFTAPQGIIRWRDNWPMPPTVAAALQRSTAANTLPGLGQTLSRKPVQGD